MDENKREYGSQSAFSNDEIEWISTASILFYKKEWIIDLNTIRIYKDVCACVFSPKFQMN